MTVEIEIYVPMSMPIYVLCIFLTGDLYNRTILAIPEFCINLNVKL